MKLIEKRMNLFDLPAEYTLVHCISNDCAMGAGIALKFDKEFPNMKRRLIETIAAKRLRYPFSIMYVEAEQRVINMVTKEKYWNKPTYNDFLHSLLDVVQLCEKYNIKKLGMPKIGCGLDKLQWEKVKEMIEDNFKDLDIEIVVCYL